jgi:hypothetical protein
MSDVVPGSVGPTGDGPNPSGNGPFGGRPSPFGGRRGPEVGFSGSDPITAGLLARYLVGRVVAARVSISLMITALVLVAGAVALWIWGPHWLAIVVGLLALAVLAFRALVVTILRRLMGVGRLGPVEDKVRALVADTQGDLRRELRRIGLPATVFGMPLLMIRLIGRHRAATFARLRQLDVNRVVPRSRQDELQFLVTSQLRRP